MAYRPFPIGIYRGINGGINEARLQDGEVVDSSNFLFRKGEAKVRPGLSDVAVTGAVTNSRYARSFPNVGGTPITLVIGSGNNIYSLDSSNTLTEITGAGITFESGLIPSVEMVNRVLLIGGNTGGMVRWDPTGGVYTVLAAESKFRFVVGHIQRAFGAYALTGTGAQIKVGWSSAGDETVWTPASSNSAGSAVLTDMNQDITGLCVLKNVVVICRSMGFHIAYPTGVVSPAFRFEGWCREGAGVFYPDTLAYSDNFAAFVGEDDVYTFDLQNITPIGFKVRDQLIRILKTGFKYRGLLMRAETNSSVRFCYHLAPIYAETQQPHFIYDFYEDSWTKCNYEEALDFRFAFNRYPTSSGGFTFMGDNGNMARWDEQILCESPAWMELPTKYVVSEDQDARVEYAYLRHRNYGRLEGVRISLNAVNGDGNRIGVSDSIAHGAGMPDGRYIRTRFRFGVKGNSFVPRIDVDPNVPFATDQLTLAASGGGEFQGKAENT